MSLRLTITFPLGDPRPKLARLPRATYEGLVDWAEEISEMGAAKAKQNITDSGRVDRGLTRAGITPSVVARPTAVEARVDATAAQSQWVERGRRGRRSSPANLNNFPEGSRLAGRAAWPPVSVIRAWVQRHARVLAPSGRTASGRARKARAADVDSLAYLIGRKIALRGIPASPFLGPALEWLQPQAQPLLIARVNARIARL